MRHPEVFPLAIPASPFAELRKVWAYMKKEFLIQMSYRFAFMFSLFGIFTTIATYFFIDRLFGRQMKKYVAMVVKMPKSCVIASLSSMGVGWSAAARLRSCAAAVTARRLPVSLKT